MKKITFLFVVLFPLASLAQTTAGSDSTKYNSIVKYYSRLITPQTTDASVFFKRGDAYFNLGDYQNALADLNKAIALNANYEEAFFSRGRVRYTRVPLMILRNQLLLNLIQVQLIITGVYPGES